MSTPEKHTPVQEISWIKIFFSLFTIFLLRALLENYSNMSDAQGNFMSWHSFAMHIPLSYFSIYISMLLIIAFITKQDLKKVAIFLTYANLLVLLAPIIDILVNGTKIHTIGYLIIEKKDFFSVFFKAALPNGIPTATIGMYTTVCLLSIFLGIYTYKKTGSLIRVLGVIFLNYTTLFLYAILPSLLILFESTSSVNNVFKSFVYKILLDESWITKSIIPLADKNEITVIANDILFSQIFWILILIQLFALCYFRNKKQLLIILRDIRLTRTFNYLLLSILGIYIGERLYGSVDLLNPINVITLSVFFILMVLNSILAASINDLEDIQIDQLSNPNRPLVSNKISLKEWHRNIFIFSFLIAIGIFTLCSVASLFLIAVQGLYYIYSSHPLRLKRHFIFSSILMGAATVFSTMAGFFLVFPDKGMLAFPVLAIFLIGISQAILSNMKDIKDYQGDKEANIRTLPVVIGLQKSKQIIALLYGLVFISVPFFVGASSMFLFSLFFSAFVYYLFTKENYQEKFIFLNLFAYMLTLFISTF